MHKLRLECRQPAWQDRLFPGDAQRRPKRVRAAGVKPQPAHVLRESRGHSGCEHVVAMSTRVPAKLSQEVIDDAIDAAAAIVLGGRQQLGIQGDTHRGAE